MDRMRGRSGRANSLFTVSGASSGWSAWEEAALKEYVFSLLIVFPTLENCKTRSEGVLLRRSDSDIKNTPRIHVRFAPSLPR